MAALLPTKPLSAAAAVSFPQTDEAFECLLASPTGSHKVSPTGSHTGDRTSTAAGVPTACAAPKLFLKLPLSFLGFTGKAPYQMLINVHMELDHT